jgi:hypothetical protein
MSATRTRPTQYRVRLRPSLKQRRNSRPIAHRPADLFEQRRPRFYGWELPSLIGLAGSLGSPGLHVTSSSMTTICWAVGLGCAGASHVTNAVRCQRWRSIWSGPAFIILAAVGLFWGTKSSALSWDNIWTVACAVWLWSRGFELWRPHRRYRQGTEPTRLSRVRSSV